MKASFTNAIVWQIDAECRSPLRTGGADGDTEAVLRSHDGRAMLQGSSIAGSLRCWIDRSRYRVQTKTLFGTQERGGGLRISDAFFAPESEMAIRPRLRIDAVTGTAAEGSKFDIAHMETGSRFSFTVTLLGNDTEADAAALEAALAALNSGEITLGAQKTNGFGQVRLSVRKRCFDMTRQADRDAWLNDDMIGEPITLPSTVASSKVLFTVVGTVGSLSVKSGQQESSEDNSKKSYAAILREAGKPVLPGSSIKGALRARAEIIADYVGLPDELIHAVFGSDAGADHLTSGKVICGDAYPTAQTAKISRIRINKFTGGVIRGALFTEEAVGGEITLRISVEDSCPQGCALVLYALRDLGLGLWNLGGGGSVGRGYLKLRGLNATAPDGRALMLRFDENGCRAEDPDKLAAQWIQTLKEATE